MTQQNSVVSKVLYENLIKGWTSVHKKASYEDIIKLIGKINLIKCLTLICFMLGLIGILGGFIFLGVFHQALHSVFFTSIGIVVIGTCLFMCIPALKGFKEYSSMHGNIRSVCEALDITLEPPTDIESIRQCIRWHLEDCAYKVYQSEVLILDNPRLINGIVSWAEARKKYKTHFDSMYSFFAKFDLVEDKDFYFKEAFKRLRSEDQQILRPSK